MTIESHPLKPFLPINGRMLFLGSFPPPRARWSMEFFYPNWINDFWRILGLIHFGDKKYFEVEGEKRFDKERIIYFANEKGLAFYDTATKVRRLKDNASDNFLEIVEPTDISSLLQKMPNCEYIITTGGKASEEVQRQLTKMVGLTDNNSVSMPKIGDSITIDILPQPITWFRMPSSSRAYPLSLEKKAEYYKRLF